MSTPNGNLVRQAARSVKWTTLSNAVPRLITPISTIILSALLTPADFGLVAIATVVITLAQIMVDLGLGTAVIQCRAQIDEAASTALWLSLLVAACLYAILWIAAPGIAVAYQSVRAVDVIRVAAFVLPLSALSSIPKALLQRSLKFPSLFWITASLLVTQAVVSVALAATGAGAWALIWGQVAGQGLSTALAWGLVQWRPVLGLNWSVLRSLLGFSLWVMASGFQTWLFLYADNAIAGLFLGKRQLGIYALGFNIANLLTGFVVSSLATVAYPTFCALPAGAQEIGRYLLRLQMLVGAILLPAALGLAVVAEPLVELLYGPRWSGLGTVVGFLAVMPGLSHIWSLNADAYRAIGRPDIWTKLAGLTLLGLMPLLWVAAPHGLLAFTLARFGGAWLLPLGHVLIGARVLGITTEEQLKAFAPSLSCAVVMFAAAYLLINQLRPFEGTMGWAKLFLIIIVAASIYLLLLWKVSRALWDRLFLALGQLLS